MKGIKCSISYLQTRYHPTIQHICTEIINTYLTNEYTHDQLRSVNNTKMWTAARQSCTFVTGALLFRTVFSDRPQRL